MFKGSFSQKLQLNALFYASEHETFSADIKTLCLLIIYLPKLVLIVNFQLNFNSSTLLGSNGINPSADPAK